MLLQEKPPAHPEKSLYTTLLVSRIWKQPWRVDQCWNDHVDELKKDGVLNGCSIGAFVDVIMTMTGDYEVDGIKL